MPIPVLRELLALIATTVLGIDLPMQMGEFPDREIEIGHDEEP